MDVDSRLGRAFENEADALRPDVVAALRDVHDRRRRRTTRRALVGAAATVLVAAGLVVRAGLDDRPTQVIEQPGRLTLSVIQERSAESLGLNRLLRAAVAPDGRVYVTDSSQQVAELSPDLELVRTWGSAGDADGQFRFVQGSIATDDRGRVYVSDAGNFRVQVFSPDGRFLRSLGELGTDAGQFSLPFDLVADDDGSVYLADDREQTVTKLAPDGRQVWRIGGKDETDERLRGYFHLSSLDGDGRLIASIDDTGLVLLLDPADGHVAGTLPLGAAPTRVCDVTTDSAGRLYVTPCIAPWDVRILEPDGTVLGVTDDLALAQSPHWGADGRGYAVTPDGGIVEVALGSE